MFFTFVIIVYRLSKGHVVLAYGRLAINIVDLCDMKGTLDIMGGSTVIARSHISVERNLCSDDDDRHP